MRLAACIFTFVFLIIGLTAHAGIAPSSGPSPHSGAKIKKVTEEAHDEVKESSEKSE